MQYSGLLIDVARCSQGVAERPGQDHRARRPDLFGVGSVDGNADGCDAAGFDHALNQSHGLMADASGWCQQDRIHVHLL